MPRFIVQVEFTQKRTREITVWAEDERAACDKAEDIVLGWDDVTDAEAIGADEE